VHRAGSAQRTLALAPVLRPAGVTQPVVQHREVVRGQETATAVHAVGQLRSLADRHRALPGGLDHRHQRRAAGRLVCRPIEQHVAKRKAEVRRIAERGHLGLRQGDRLGVGAELLQCEQQPQHQIVAPRIARLRTVQRTLVAGQGIVKAGAQLEILAELVVQVAIVGALRQRLAQQSLVAPLLAAHAGVHVAVVPHGHGQAPARPVGSRLFVDAPLVARTARQHARQPARRTRGMRRVRTVQVVDPQHAYINRLLRAQQPQRGGAIGQPLVGVEHQRPVGIGLFERGIARGREVVAPVEVAHPCAGTSCQLRRGVTGAGVEHEHRVDMRAHARQAAFDAARLVARDHHQRQTEHPRS
jgi:hypothetical protein